MGTLNNNLGMNLTDENPLISNPYNYGESPFEPLINQNAFLLLQSPSSDFLLLNGQTLTLL